jgi:hypothetical protein
MFMQTADYMRILIFHSADKILFLEIKEKASVYLGKTYFTVLATTSEDPNMDQLLKKRRRRRNK